MLIFPLASCLILLIASKPGVALTVYTSETGTAAFAQYTVASTDQTFLTPPPAPANQAASIPVQLYEGGMNGMGLPVVRIHFHSVSDPQALTMSPITEWWFFGFLH